MADVPTTDLPDPDHRTPAGVDDATVEALGKLSEALETCERARGHLYAFHQLTGSADIELGEAVSAFREAGHARARRPTRVGAGRPQRAGRPVDLPDRRGVRRHVLVSVPFPGEAGAGRARRRSTPPVRGTPQAGRADGRSGPPRSHASRRPQLRSSRQTSSAHTDLGSTTGLTRSISRSSGRPLSRLAARTSCDAGHQVGDLHPGVVSGIDPTQVENVPRVRTVQLVGDLPDPPRRQDRLLVVDHDEIAVLRSPIEHTPGQRRQQRLDQGWPTGADLQRPAHRPRPLRGPAQPEQSLPHRSGSGCRGERFELTLEVGDGGCRHPPAGGPQRLAGRNQEGLPALQAEDGVPLAVQLERHPPDVRVLARQVESADLARAQQHVGESAEQKEAGVGEMHPHLVPEQAIRREEPPQVVVVAPSEQPARLELPVRRHPHPQPGHLRLCGLDRNSEAGVAEHRVPEGQVPAGEAGLVTGDLDRHRNALPPGPTRTPLALDHPETVRVRARTVQPVDQASVGRRVGLDRDEG